MNPRLNYLYRDAGNYKTYGSVIFKASNRRSISHLQALMEEALIEREYFVAKDVGVPDLRPAVLDSSMDHDWHEVESLDECGEPPDDRFGRTIDEFIESMAASSMAG